MDFVGGAVILFSVLFPSQTWYAPDKDISIQIRNAPADTTLVLIDSQGKLIDPIGTVEFDANRVCDIARYWRPLRVPGRYVLLAVPRGKHRSEFIGTPLVIDVRADNRKQAAPGPMTVKVTPLVFGKIITEKGEISLIFYYDAAPNTVYNFIDLARGGFYDGLTFHRIVPNAIIQTGDPKGDGTGGPGYHVEAEFGGRKHEEGVLSMSRLVDPIEAQGPMPRAEFANSGGSQFFICLDPGVSEAGGKERIYKKTMQFDGRYTAFGRIVEGLDIAREIGNVQVDPKTDKPLTPQVVRNIRIMPVTPQANPYAQLLLLISSTTAPVEIPMLEATPPPAVPDVPRIPELPRPQ